MKNSTMVREPVNRLLEPETGAFILRVSLGVVLLSHSVYLKMMVFTLPGTAQYFSSIGLPAFLAYVVFAAETVAGVALVLGIKTRFFSGLIIPVLLGATWAHSGNSWLFSAEGGGWEYPLILVLMALAQIALGDGNFSISSRQKPI